MQRRFGTLVPPSERRPIAWYAPGVLWQAGRQLLYSQDFLRNLDRREGFGAHASVIDLSARPASADAPFGFDFVSDTGDSGNATFAVAQAVLARELTVDAGGTPPLLLPEGELLIFGGDLAYPGANPAEYQFRFLELFEMARDPKSRFHRGSDPRKFVLAIPQNHDWFDSASTFCRYFVNYDKGAFIGARSPQLQTWFALRLPHDWWVLGFDWAHAGDLDRNQFEGFATLLAGEADPGIGAGANVVLLYPEPYWTRPIGDGAPEGYPHRYQRLEAMLEQRGARIRLRLAGDLHHYRREALQDPLTGVDSHLVTCGCGGAFAHPTHGVDVSAPKAIDRADEPGAIDEELRNRVRVGRVERDDPRQVRFEPAAAWPSPQRTRRLAWRNVWALFVVRFSRAPWTLSLRQLRHELWQSNLGFAACLGLLYGINAYVNSFVFTRSFFADGFGPMQTYGFVDGALPWLRAMAFSPFATLINGLMLAGCVRIAWEGPGHWSGRLASGFVHGMAQGYLVYALYWLACQWLGEMPPGLSLRYAVMSWACVGAVGAVVGALLFGVYFALMSGLFGQLPNNAFGSLAVEDYKGFLRCTLDERGLTVRMLGIDVVPRRWRPTRGAQPSRGWRVIDEFTLKS